MPSHLARLAAALLLALCLAAPAIAAPSLFSDLPPADERPAVPDAFAKRARRVAADASLLAAGGPARIALPFFADANFTAVFTRTSKGDASETWFGTLDGTDPGYVAITHSGGSMIGTVVAGGSTYDVMPSEQGVHTLREVNTGAKPRCGNAGGMPPRLAPSVAVGQLADEPIAGSPADNPLANVTGPRLARRQAQPGADGIYTVDLLALWTPAAAAKWAPTSPQLVIEHDVQLTTDSYRNSGVSMRMRLVHAAQVAYTERGTLKETFSNALDDLGGVNDGYMDNIHALRNQYGADLVALYIDNYEYCGLGYQITVPGGSSNPDFGFSVTSASCIADWTLAHETGHNSGCAHDRETEGATGKAGAYTYSYGYLHREGANSFRTIMSYECKDVECPTVGYFSNPNVAYNGRPTGVANSEDNARTLNNMAAEVAGFRATSVPPPPPPPPGPPPPPPPPTLATYTSCGAGRTCCGTPLQVLTTTVANCEATCNDPNSPCYVINYDPSTSTCRLFASNCGGGRWTASANTLFGAAGAANCPALQGCTPPPPSLPTYAVCGVGRTCCGTPLRTRTLANAAACEAGCEANQACYMVNWNPSTRVCREYGPCARWTAAAGTVLGHYDSATGCPATQGCPVGTRVVVAAASARRLARVTLRATVTRADNRRPVGNVQVTFRINGAVVGRARTNAQGVATLAYTVPRTLRLGRSTIAARFDGGGSFTAGSGTAVLTVRS
ncbi:hypothetical protein DFJ74DRAFT_704933 [Hyaloraphidium curvatum]|nr:hypothetical protein DFJ74DRAFT_704933 [Hyaloraphidium curvatum]